MKLKDLKLVYNAAAHFNAAEKYPDGLVKELQKPGEESFEALFWTLAEMVKQGELVRRYMGETPRQIPTAEQFKMILRPNQIAKVTAMVFEELARGLGTNNDDEEIDLVLLEYEKKTNTD